VPTQFILLRTEISFCSCHPSAFVMGEAVKRVGMAFGVFVLFASAASAADFPARKPGLWAITIAGAHSIVVRQCSDAASDEAVLAAGIGNSGNCAKPDVQQSGNTIAITSVCKSGSKTTTSHMVISGSLESKYTMTMTGQDSAKPTTLYAEWLGPCEANQKPGDVIMPNGVKINLLSAERHASSGQ
jgi:Protein of unknown function (DUF3617)